ncbi:MAG TPA: hypothetical protein VF783_03870 [Terriglobales bacterium]
MAQFLPWYRFCDNKFAFKNHHRPDKEESDRNCGKHGTSPPRVADLQPFFYRACHSYAVARPAQPPVTTRKKDGKQPLNNLTFIRPLNILAPFDHRRLE